MVCAECGEDSLQTGETNLVTFEPVTLNHWVVLDCLGNVHGPLFSDTVTSLDQARMM